MEDNKKEEIKEDVGSKSSLVSPYASLFSDAQWTEIKSELSKSDSDRLFLPRVWKCLNEHKNLEQFRVLLTHFKGRYDINCKTDFGVCLLPLSLSLSRFVSAVLLSWIHSNLCLYVIYTYIYI